MTPSQEHDLAILACAIADAIEAHDAECALRILARIEEHRQTSSAGPAPCPRHDARPQRASEESYKKP